MDADTASAHWLEGRFLTIYEKYETEDCPHGKGAFASPACRANRCHKTDDRHDRGGRF